MRVARKRVAKRLRADAGGGYRDSKSRKSRCGIRVNEMRRAKRADASDE